MTDRLQGTDKHHKVFRSAHIAIGLNPTRNISEMIGTKSNINMNTSTTTPSTCKLEDDLEANVSEKDKSAIQ